MRSTGFWSNEFWNGVYHLEVVLVFSMVPILVLLNTMDHRTMITIEILTNHGSSHVPVLIHVVVQVISLAYYLLLSARSVQLIFPNDIHYVLIEHLAEFKKFCIHFNLFLIISMYSASISNPKKSYPKSFATFNVVPLPANGSIINVLISAVVKIIRLIISSGI